MDRGRSDEELIEGADAVHARVCSGHRDLFAAIAEIDRRQAWRDWGARDLAHWLCLRYGMSWWKAARWVTAARALEDLPKISEAFGSGELGVDKVVELTRFATPETEAALIPWAQEVSVGCIRHKGDLVTRPSIQEAREAETARRLDWWYFAENSRFGLSAELPAAQGAVVARALDRLAESLPVMPGEDHTWDAEARRADALVVLCSARIASDPDPDRATVVVHARLDGLVSGVGGCEVEGGPVIHPQTVRRLLCTGRIQTVVEDGAGRLVGMGGIVRDPPAWMLRQLRYRDYGCVFLGCGTRRFTQAHHVRWWRLGGRTDLDNLVLVCSFHHKLVHEFGWRLTRGGDGTVRWFRPDGTGYRAGPGPPDPAPPDQKAERHPALSAVGA